MFGRLPRIYRWRTVAIALLVFVVAGAWLVTFTSIPMVASIGAMLGGLAGVLVAYALVHDFSRRPQLARISHRR